MRYWKLPGVVAMALCLMSGALTAGCSSAVDAELAHQQLTETLAINLQIPSLHGAQDILLSATESLRMDARTTTGATGGSEVVASAGQTHVAAGANIHGSVLANGDIFMGARSVITGTLTAAGTVTKQHGVQIGIQNQASSVPFNTITFSVLVPETSGGDVRLEPGQRRHIPPGRYGAFDVKPGAEPLLSSGIYFFDSFQVQPQAEILTNKTAGPIQIYVQSSFEFKGAFVQNGGKPEDLFVGYLGSGDAFVQGAFVGTLVAPTAEIALHRPTSNQPHQGAFFAKRLRLFSDATVLHTPFPWALLIGERLVGDPDFAQVGPDDVPATTPPASPIGPQCGPEFAAVVDPAVDANGDGFPDIISFQPAPLNRGCVPPTFCQPFTLPNGGEGFAPVASDPLFHPSLPIPAAAVTLGCTGEAAAPICPVLGSSGTRALACEALSPQPDCVTVSMCPDPGSWEDPGDPDVRRVFDATSSDTLPFSLPTGTTDVAPGQILQVLESLSPFYVNPCEWDQVLDQFTFDIDIRGNGLDAGQPCASDEDCKGVCTKPEGGLFGICNKPESPLKVNVDEGSSSWNVRFNAGISEGRVNVRRAIFFPSAEFDVRVRADAVLTAAAFGTPFHLYELDIVSELSQCGFNFDWQSKSGDDLFNVINGLVRQSPLGPGVFIPGNVADLNAASDPGATATCLANLAALRGAEKHLNEAFHNALVASTFFNLAGPTGSVITSRARAETFLDAYRAAANTYQTALASYQTSQQAALEHDIAGQVGDFEVNLELAFVRSYGIGPFNPALEIGVYGRAGMNGIDMQNTAAMHFSDSPAKPCAGVACFEITAAASVAPKAAAGLFAFIGGGLNLAVAGGEVGIRGELDLINAQLPMAGSFGLRGRTLPPEEILEAVRSIPSALSPTIPGPAGLVATSAFEVPLQVEQLAMPFAVGAHLQSLDNPLAVDAQFLSGSIKLWAKAWFLFVTKKWEKTLVSWQGIHREWHVGDPLPDGSFAELSKVPGVARPNMVLLPKLALVAVPGTADPVSTSNAINAALDTQVTPNSGIRFAAHHQEDLILPWTRGAAARCRIDPGPR